MDIKSLSCLKASINSLFVLSSRLLRILWGPLTFCPCPSISLVFQSFPFLPFRSNLDFTYFRKPFLIAAKLYWASKLYSLHYVRASELLFCNTPVIMFLYLSPTDFSFLEGSDCWQSSLYPRAWCVVDFNKMFEIIDLSPRSVLVRVFIVLFIGSVLMPGKLPVSCLNSGSNVTFMRTYPTSPSVWLCLLLCVCVCVCVHAHTEVCENS